MKLWARMTVFAYVLAIVVASMAPHCDAMFSAPVQAQTVADDCDHDNTGESDKPETSKRECASMAMAKSVGPLPGASFDFIRTSVAVSAVSILQGSPLTLEPAAVAAPRGPPPSSQGGFASIFASNHRLLI